MRYAVITLPRSRSTWLAEWLGAEHEALSRIGSLDELTVEGIVDTGSALFFDALWHRWPDARYLFVFRDMREIATSCERVGLPIDGLPALRTRQEVAYASVAGAPNVRAVHFHQLDDMDTLARLWSFLKGTKFDEGRAREMIGRNIQCDIPAILGGLDAARTQRLVAAHLMKKEKVSSGAQ
jgi:hypothetical protein